MNSMPYIYALGGGCWPYAAIKEVFGKEYRSPSVFRAFNVQNSINSISKKFMPLELFNGNLKRYQDDYKAWKYFYINNQVILSNSHGFQYMHVNEFKQNILSFKTRYSDEWFGFFDKHKYSQLYVIDFQKSGYEKYENSQLIEFEKFLVKSQFNLDNFMYIDVKDNPSSALRFRNTKIRSYLNEQRDIDKICMKNYPHLPSSNSLYFYHMHKEKIINEIEKFKSNLS